MRVKCGWANNEVHEPLWPPPAFLFREDAADGFLTPQPVKNAPRVGDTRVVYKVLQCEAAPAGQEGVQESLQDLVLLVGRDPVGLPHAIDQHLGLILV